MCVTIINIIAVLVSPVIAVLVAQKLQDRSERRKDKLNIFKTLMTSRMYGWTIDSVNAMNIIDIVFSDDKAVRKAWKNLYDKYHIDAEKADSSQLKKIEIAKNKLLEIMAKSLGYKNVVDWEMIQNPYVPTGLAQNWEIQNQQQIAYINALNTINQIVSEREGSSTYNNES